MRNHLRENLHIRDLPGFLFKQKLSHGFLTILLCFIFPGYIKAQFLQPADTLNSKRVNVVGIGGGLVYASATTALSIAWYGGYPRQTFGFFNDNDQWLQMDKAGHALTGYQVSRYGFESLQWAGVRAPESAFIGGSYSLLFLTTMEVLDGYSAGWGFSWGDMAANVTGVGLFVGQQFLWNEQRVAMKFSYSPTDLTSFRPELLGSSHPERIFKDYNGQTVWLSVNPASFFPEREILPWLNIALGYGANGMLGGSDNPLTNRAGEVLPIMDRYRQYYLSLDIDLSRIETRSNVLKTIFSVVGFVKIPAPAIEFSQGDVQWHWIHF